MGNCRINPELAAASGNLTLMGDTARIIHMAADGTQYQAIAFHKGDDTGGEIVVSSGGRTVIGAGEAAQHLIAVLGTNEAKEDAHICADNVIYVHTDCQTIGNRHTFTFKKDGTLTVPGNVAQGSDRRIKEDIRPIPEEMIEAFDGLSPKAYAMRRTGRQGIGLIAQDVQGTALEAALVREGEDGMLAIDYSCLHGLEIEEIRRLWEQVASLLARVEELENGAGR